MKKMMLLLLVLCLFLCGCDSADEIPTDETELWVVTELTGKYGMNDQASRMIDAFQGMYPNVTVKLDILPTDDEERAAYLEKLRTQIMGGSGPDVYLLPTHHFVPDPTSIYGLDKEVVPLFRDPVKCMYNCIFYDISEYYDADESLEKEELNTAVMDSGVMDGCRYIIPLRYGIGAYLVDRENLEAQGMDVGVFEGGMKAVAEASLELENTELAYSSGLSYEYYFTEYVDYAAEQVMLAHEELTEFMRLKQAVEYLGGSYIADMDASIGQYMFSGHFFAERGYGLRSATLSTAVEAIAIAQALGEEIEVYPMLNGDGKINAKVHYYGAVGGGCAYPRLAYEFLRLFLLEEAQYESYLTSGQYRLASDPVCPGWPVRTVGSAEAKLETMLYQVDAYIMYREYPSRQKKILDAELSLTYEDIPAFNWKIDEVIYPIVMEYEDSLSYYVNALNDFDNNNAPEDVDIDALAAEYIGKLQQYLDEG